MGTWQDVLFERKDLLYPNNWTLILLENLLHAAHQDVVLGSTEYENVKKSVNSLNNKRGKYKSCSDEEKYSIGKYANETGATA